MTVPYHSTADWLRPQSSGYIIHWQQQQVSVLLIVFTGHQTATITQTSKISLPMARQEPLNDVHQQ